MIVGIVAVDKNWGIGKNNGLLFTLKEDMKFFRKTTENSIVTMGYNTLLSFPGSKPLKNRTNVVLCPEGVKIPGCICIHDFNEMVDYVEKNSKNGNVYIIGGAMYYKSMLDYYDIVYVTKVDAVGDATVFFPNLDEDSRFECIRESDPILDNGYNIRFTTYKATHKRS